MCTDRPHSLWLSPTERALKPSTFYFGPGRARKSRPLTNSATHRFAWRTKEAGKRLSGCCVSSNEPSWMRARLDAPPPSILDRATQPVSSRPGPSRTDRDWSAKLKVGNVNIDQLAVRYRSL